MVIRVLKNRLRGDEPRGEVGVPMTEPSLQTIPKEHRRLHGTLLIACAVAALAGVSALPERHRRMPVSEPAAPIVVQKASMLARFPLQLNVEAQGKGLNIRWNPQSAAVIDAHN
jgi:hypothetical protein